MIAVFNVKGKEVGRRVMDDSLFVGGEIRLDFDTAKATLQHDYFDPICRNFNEAVFQLRSAHGMPDSEHFVANYEFVRKQ